MASISASPSQRVKKNHRFWWPLADREPGIVPAWSPLLITIIWGRIYHPHFKGGDGGSAEVMTATVSNIVLGTQAPSLVVLLTLTVSKWQVWDYSLHDPKAFPLPAGPCCFSGRVLTHQPPCSSHGHILPPWLLLLFGQGGKCIHLDLPFNYQQLTMASRWKGRERPPVEGGASGHLQEHCFTLYPGRVIFILP